MADRSNDQMMNDQCGAAQGGVTIFKALPLQAYDDSETLKEYISQILCVRMYSGSSKRWMGKIDPLEERIAKIC